MHIFFYSMGKRTWLLSFSGQFPLKGRNGFVKSPFTNFFGYFYFIFSTLLYQRTGRSFVSIFAFFRFTIWMSRISFTKPHSTYSSGFLFAIGTNPMNGFASPKMTFSKIKFIFRYIVSLCGHFGRTSAYPAGSSFKGPSNNWISLSTNFTSSYFFLKYLPNSR